MSKEIGSALPPITPPIPPTPKPAEDRPAQVTSDSKAQAEQPSSIRKALHKISAGHEHDDDKSFKAFTHLARDLEKAFGSAKKVDHDDAEEELHRGGMKRIGKDLRKLFKGLGMPGQLAKHFSREITHALKEDDVEQVNFSLATTRSFSFAATQTQEAYLADGEGKMVAASLANSFQLTAVQTRSVDVSINLRTGEFSLNRSQFDAISVSSSSTAALASYTPAQQAIPTAAAAEPQQPATAPEDIAAAIQKDSSLLTVSRSVKQSAVMQLQPASKTEDHEDSDDELFSDGLGHLQQLVGRLAELSEAVEDLFESLTQISNLRVEHDDDDDDDHLRFTVDAQAPIGLTEIDDDDHATTLYPRPDGQLGKLMDDSIKVTV